MPTGLGEYFSDVAPQQAPGLHPGATAGAPALEPPVTRTSVLMPPAGLPQIQGTGEYFAQNGLGEYFAQNGMGAFNGGPVPPARKPGAFRKVASRVSPFAGALGDMGDVISDTKSGFISGAAAATTLTGIILGMGLRFGAGWIVGKALAPSAKDEKAYTWGGAIGSVLFGSVGLGIEALVAQNARK